MLLSQAQENQYIFSAKKKPRRQCVLVMSLTQALFEWQKRSGKKMETCTHIFPKTKWTAMKTTHDSDFQSSLQTRSPQRKLFLDLTSTTKQTLYPVKYLTVNQC